MESFGIKQAEFIISVGAGGVPPAPLAVEIAIVGRSNVGKSSLINCLCQNKKLARISQHPGKTRLVNYFRINKSFYLVDLPGYGFAKASKSEKEGWAELVGGYMSSGRVSHVLLLLDIRHAPTSDDRQMYNWILFYGMPFTLVATKADKIAVSKRKQAANTTARLLGAPPAAIPFSASSGGGSSELIARIGQIYTDAVSLFGQDY